MFTILTSVYINDDPIEFDLSLESIYNQTLQAPQIVLVVDGPVSEEISHIISKYQNLFSFRLEVYQLDSNVGLANALNFGLTKVKNELVARHDADDISMPDRFEIQVAYMINNPYIDILGSQVIEGCDIKYAKVTRRLPLNHHEIVSSMWIRNPVNHPTVIYKKSHIKRVGGYSSYFGDDDYLWAKLYVAGATFENLPDSLVFLRRNDAVFNRRGAKWCAGDLEVRKLLFRNNKIGLLKLLVSIVTYSIYRYSPSSLKKIVYKLRGVIRL